MWDDERRGEPATAKVAGVEQGLAQVLIGDDEEEWCFPLSTLPPHTVVGDGLLLMKVDGRYQAIKRMPGAEAGERSFEDRLARRLVREHIPAARRASTTTTTGERREPTVSRPSVVPLAAG